MAGVGVILLLVPINRAIAKKIVELSEKMMKEKDERVKVWGKLLIIS